MPLSILIRESSLQSSLRQGLTDIPSLRDEYSDEEDREKCKCPYPSVGGIWRWLIQPSLVLLLISLSAPDHLQSFLDSRKHRVTTSDLLEWASTYARSQPQKGFVLAPLNPSFLPLFLCYHFPSARGYRKNAGWVQIGIVEGGAKEWVAFAVSRIGSVE